MTGLPRSLSFVDRLERYVAVTEDGCWNWHSVAGNGYGYMVWKGKRCKATRAVWEEMVAPIQPGLELDHLCRNKRCVNPDHLEPVTHQENVRRGRAGHHMKGKTECREGHPLQGDNLYVTPGGTRVCKACRIERKRAHRRGMTVREYRRDVTVRVG